MQQAVVCRRLRPLHVLLFLSVGTLNARDADLVSHAFAAAQTDTCRARYRDCRRLNQIPSFECRGVYRDCGRYTCTGLHRGRVGFFDLIQCS
jgi:hypothetical protein